MPTTIEIKDANGNNVVIPVGAELGRASAANSKPVVLSSEDKTSLDAISTGLTTLAGYVDGLEGYVDGLETLITSTNTKLDTLAGYVDGLETLNGAVNETAPASDTASSGHNGRLQRIAQRLTSLIALYPTALGRTAATGSFAVVLSTEDKSSLDAVGTKLDTIAGYVDGLEGFVDQLEGYVDGLETLNGAVNETALASDTASSGLNGRLQRIAQRITSLIELLPTSLGQKAAANSLSVVLASDQTLPLPSGAATAAKQPALGTAGVPSSDIIAIQGHDSGNPVLVDGSTVTQPISAASLVVLLVGGLEILRQMVLFVKWQRNGVDISGENGPDYTLVTADATAGNVRFGVSFNGGSTYVYSSTVSVA